jgi:hypothetical protein
VAGAKLLHSIYIFGAGTAGLRAYKHLSKSYKVLGFFDNDESKHGTELSGIPILNPDSVTLAGDHKIFVASEFFEQIKTQLVTQLNIDASKVYHLPARMMVATPFSDSQPSIHMEILRICCDYLADLNCKFHIDAGTLLGLYRDQSLIPWDDDLDVAVDSEHVDTIASTIFLLVRKLEEKTLETWHSETLFSSNACLNVPKNAIRSFKLSPKTGSTLPSIDFFVKYVANDYSDYCLASRGIRMPSEYTYQLQSYNVGNYTFPIPGAVEAYLTYHYGDWQKPNPEWSLQDLENSKVFE